VLINEDFPTLDLPANAISGNPVAGYWEGLVALVINSADLMIMVLISGLWSLDSGFNQKRIWLNNHILFFRTLPKKPAVFRYDSLKASFSKSEPSL
jgi:hypothetical protein